jgi:hypothetical protein
MKKGSQRFKPSPWTDRLVSVWLILLLLGLIATLIIVGLSLAGVIPG